MIQLYLNGILVVLSPDTEIEIERTSPIWNESGSFSYPFPVPYKPNIGIFGDLNMPESNLKAVESSFKFELYSSGILILSGLATIDSGLFDDEANVPLILSSGKNTFYNKIDGVKCNEMPLLKDDLDQEIKIKIGYSTFKRSINPLPGTNHPPYLDSWGDVFYNNVIYPYDQLHPYCTTSIISSNGTIGGHDRKYPGICFYLLYVVDCIFKYSGYTCDKSMLDRYKDMNRLAIFTTKCDYDINVLVDPIPNEVGTYITKEYYATNKNFPEVNLEDIINSLKTAFGVVFLFDEYQNRCKLSLYKDILLDKSVTVIDIPIIDINKIHEESSSVIIKYSNSEDDNTSFNYDKYSDYKKVESYNDIIEYNKNGLRDNDTTCYIDETTANAYRIKVDKETNDEPAFFEVGQYSQVKKGDGTNEIEIEIPFIPVIPFDITKSDIKKLPNYGDKGISQAIYVDKEVESRSFSDGTVATGFGYTYQIDDDWEKFSKEAKVSEFILGVMRGFGSGGDIIITTPSTVIDPTLLGGNTYDISQASNPAFTADSISVFGNLYDYNGSDNDGLGYDSESNSIFSLKIDANKPLANVNSIVKPDRGLYHRFLREYVYFLLNRKSIEIKSIMTESQLSSIDWTKKYKIDQYEGYINRLKFSLRQDGLSTVEIEMFMI